MCKQEKNSFILNQIFSMSLQAAVQHSKTYESGDRVAFQCSLQKLLNDYASQYKIEVSEKTHYANIERLAKTLSEKHSKTLVGERFRIGPAQKVLNLYLKYLWCLGLIKMPPHCPIDGTVLAAIKNSTAWTNIDCIDDYKKIIEEVKKVASHMQMQPSEWELQLFNNKVDQRCSQADIPS